MDVSCADPPTIANVKSSNSKADVDDETPPYTWVEKSTVTVVLSSETNVPVMIGLLVLNNVASQSR